MVLTLLATIGRNPDALDTLSTTTVVLLLLAFIMVNISVLVLRSDEVEHEHFRTPSVFPILGILVSASLLIYTAIDDWTVFGLAGLLLGIGVVLYGVNVLVKRSLDQETPAGHGVRRSATGVPAGQKWLSPGGGSCAAGPITWRARVLYFRWLPGDSQESP